MYLTMIGVITLEVGFNWIGAFVWHFGIAGLWAVHLIDEIIRLALNYWRFKSGRWKTMKV